MLSCQTTNTTICFTASKVATVQVDKLVWELIVSSRLSSLKNPLPVDSSSTLSTNYLNFNRNVKQQILLVFSSCKRRNIKNEIKWAEIKTLKSLQTSPTKSLCRFRLSSAFQVTSPPRGSCATSSTKPHLWATQGTFIRSHNLEQLLEPKKKKKREEEEDH